MVDVVVGTAFAIAFVVAFAQVGGFCARRWIPEESTSVRMLGAVVAALSFATLVFHGLLALSLFDRVVALVVVGSCALACFAAERRETAAEPPGGARPLLDPAGWRALASPKLMASGWILRASALGFGAFVLVTLTRALTLPTVGWDSITYHYVKAAMWVQTGGPIALDSPGGWSMYRAIFGGGEIFTAWSMLPFGHDGLAGAVDGFFWLALAAALHALAREFGLGPFERWAVAIQGLFIPAIWDAVGWGYVDLTHSALLLAGLLFATRYFRTNHPPLVGFALAAFGLAAGIKLTGAPILASAGLVLLTHAVRQDGSTRSGALGWLAGGSVLALLCVVPWLVQNLIETGYPLRFPMTLFGVQLGQDNAAFAWSQDRELPAYEFAAEFEALKALFLWPWVNTSHLGVASVLPLVLAPVGAIRVLRSKPDLRASLLLAALICASILVAFYDRAFSFSRLEFWWVNGRFLQWIVLLSMPLAMCAFEAGSRWRAALTVYLAGAAAVQCIAFAPLRFLHPTPGVVFGGWIGGAIFLGVLVWVLIVLRGRLLRAVALVMLILAATSALDRLREIDTRYMLLVGRNVSDDVFRYWWQGAHLAEREGDGLRIAVTAGPRKDADNWLMYYFLGADLQNSLHYLPISTDGEIIPFGPDERRRREGDVDAWLARLAEQEISHVLSLFPTSIELEWMEERPERFLRLAGFENEWAFYRVRPTTGRR